MQQATAEQTVDVPVPQDLKPTIFEDAAVPVPQIMEDIEEMIRPACPALRERITQEIFDVLAQIQERIIEVVDAISQERLQQRTAEQIAELHAPQIQEEIIEVTPQERIAFPQCG